MTTRRFETLRIDATGANPNLRIERAITAAAETLRGSIVRVYISVDAEREGEVSPARIRRELAQHEPFSIAGIRVESDIERRTRMEIQLDSATDQATMLSRWIELRSYDRNRAKLIEQLGIELIEQANDWDQEG